MHNTVQICNFRDCHADPLPECPHGAVDPCAVYCDTETGHWYDEMTGAPIRMFELGDGQVFDIQAWLSVQIGRSAKYYIHGDKVHKEYSCELPPPGRNTPAARAPEHTASALDAMADSYIRGGKQRREVHQEIKALGQELHGYMRIQKKWGGEGNALLDNRVAAIRQQRDLLRDVQSNLDRQSKPGKARFNADVEWTEKWTPKGGRWEEFVLITEFNRRLYVIDQHGLKHFGEYLYLPNEDKAFHESANYAEQSLGIPKKAWEHLTLPADKIGAPLRRYGRKNANGRRIAARFDHIRFAQDVITVARAMRAMKISLTAIADDQELCNMYWQQIAPRL